MRTLLGITAMLIGMMPGAIAVASRFQAQWLPRKKRRKKGLGKDSGECHLTRYLCIPKYLLQYLYKISSDISMLSFDSTLLIYKDGS